MTIEIKVTDQRTIEIPVRTDGGELLVASEFIRDCAQEGYELHSVEAMTGGMGYNPITTGVRLVFSRKT